MLAETSRSANLGLGGCAVLIAASLLSLGACGRTPTLGAALLDQDAGPGDARRDRSIADGRPTDQPIPPDRGRVDGPLPPDISLPDLPQPPDIRRPDTTCRPSCPDICDQVSIQCGVMPYQACLAICPSWADADRYACLSDVICKGLSGIHPCTRTKECLDDGPPPQSPDLTVSAFSATVNGSQVRYDAMICNNGQQASGGFYVDLYYNRSGAPGVNDYGDQFNQNGSLAPGGCTKASFVRGNTPPGSYLSWIQVDADNAIVEANEGNNVGGPAKVSIGSTGHADLVVQSFTTQLLSGGAALRLRARVCNGGNAAAGASELHVYVDRQAAPTPGLKGTGSVTLPALSPGSCRTRTFQRNNPAPGKYRSWAQADTMSQVPESNEGNNVAGPREVTVPGSSAKPDIVFGQFDASVQGADVFYKAELCNKGAGSANGFVVGFFHDRSSSPPDIPGDVATKVGTLAAGGCTTVTAQRSGAPAGSYTAWARADIGDLVDETSEGNNVAGPRAVLVGTPPTDCVEVCTFADACGIFSGDQFLQCITWCNGMTLTERGCLESAILKPSCDEFKKCDTPPPPPPPPPPGTCPDLCGFLINDCSLLPSAQFWTCIGACQVLPPDKISCATSAKANKQCAEVVNCMF